MLFETGSTGKPSKTNYLNGQSNYRNSWTWE